MASALLTYIYTNFFRKFHFSGVLLQKKKKNTNKDLCCALSCPYHVQIVEHHCELFCITLREEMSIESENLSVYPVEKKTQKIFHLFLMCEAIYLILWCRL